MNLFVFPLLYKRSHELNEMVVSFVVERECFHDEIECDHVVSDGRTERRHLYRVVQTVRVSQAVSFHPFLEFTHHGNAQGPGLACREIPSDHV